MNHLIQSAVLNFAGFVSQVLLPGMTIAFCGAVLLRSLIYFTVRRELWFVREFEKRLYSKLDAELASDGMPFNKYLRRVLEKTYYEIFELRTRYRRRNPDFIMTLSDRLFLIQDGAARLIRDTLKYLRYDGRRAIPDMAEVSKNVFNTNPAFSRVFGIVPASACNTLLNLLPGLFIIGGIFGTFVGIMNALPQLSNMELTNAEQTKTIMDGFLGSMSHALVSSSLGILLSVTLSVFNSLCDPEGLFLVIVDRYSSALTVAWNRCHTRAGTAFTEETDDDYEDGEGVAAHESVERQLARADVRLTWRDRAFLPQAFQPPRQEEQGAEDYSTAAEAEPEAAPFTSDLDAQASDPAPADDSAGGKVEPLHKKKSA